MIIIQIAIAGLILWLWVVFFKDIWYTYQGYLYYNRNLDWRSPIDAKKKTWESIELEHIILFIVGNLILIGIIMIL